MSTIPTSEVLNRAADLIEERGWTAGTGWGLPGDAGLCLEGGILAAMGVGFTGAPDANTCPAGRAVRQHLGMDPDVGHGGWTDLSDFRALRFWTERAPLYKWNDHPKRTESEVIEILRVCAVIEAAHEHEAAYADLSVAPIPYVLAEGATS